MKLKEIWEELPDLDYTKKYFDEKSKLRIYEVCNKKFQETASVDYVLKCLRKVEEGHGNRVQEAEENRVDFKSVSHALRAAYQTKQLLIENTITFPLKESTFLRDVKLGKVDYTTVVVPVLEDLMAEIEELSKASKLPDLVDRSYWDRFIISTLEREVF
jgi:hypothetical protein